VIYCLAVVWLYPFVCYHHFWRTNVFTRVKSRQVVRSAGGGSINHGWLWQQRSQVTDCMVYYTLVLRLARHLCVPLPMLAFRSTGDTNRTRKQLSRVGQAVTSSNPFFRSRDRRRVLLGDAMLIISVAAAMMTALTPALSLSGWLFGGLCDRTHTSFMCESNERHIGGWVGTGGARLAYCDWRLQRWAAATATLKRLESWFVQWTERNKNDAAE